MSYVTRDYSHIKDMNTVACCTRQVHLNKQPFYYLYLNSISATIDIPTYEKWYKGVESEILKDFIELDKRGHLVKDITTKSVWVF